MLTITISGERGVGKSVLGILLKKLLEAWTPYTVELFEECGSNTTASQFKIWANNFKMSDLVPRTVRIIVKNPNLYEERALTNEIKF